MGCYFSHHDRVQQFCRHRTRGAEITLASYTHRAAMRLLSLSVLVTAAAVSSGLARRGCSKDGNRAQAVTMGFSSCLPSLAAASSSCWRRSEFSATCAAFWPDMNIAPEGREERKAHKVGRTGGTRGHLAHSLRESQPGSWAQAAHLGAVPGRACRQPATHAAVNSSQL